MVDDNDDITEDVARLRLEEETCVVGGGLENFDDMKDRMEASNVKLVGSGVGPWTTDPQQKSNYVAVRRRRHSEGDINIIKVNVSKLDFKTRDSLDIVHQQLLDGGEIDLLPPACGISAVVYPPTANYDVMTLPKTREGRYPFITQWIGFVKLAKFMACPKSVPSVGVILQNISIRRNSDKKYDEQSYDIKREIDRGNFGTVELVVDSQTGVNAARKKIELHDFREEEVLSFVDLECKDAVGKKVPWPILFGVQYVHETQVVYMFSEYLSRAQKLRDILTTWNKARTTGDNFHEKLIHFFPVYLLEQLTSALDKLHRGGWVHGDLHGGNIMLQPLDNCELRVLLIDFGKAICTTENATSLSLRSLPDSTADSHQPQNDVLYMGSHFLAFRHKYEYGNLDRQLEAVEETKANHERKYPEKQIHSDILLYENTLRFFLHDMPSAQMLKKFIQDKYKNDDESNNIDLLALSIDKLFLSK